jgi:hypothetical protein
VCGWVTETLLCILLNELLRATAEWTIHSTYDLSNVLRV